MISLDKLYSYFEQDKNYIRLKELENSFDQNKDVLNLIKRKQEVSKNLVNSRALHLSKNSKALKDEYDKINEELENYPLLGEYLDLLEYFNNLLQEIIFYLEKNINNNLN